MRFVTVGTALALSIAAFSSVPPAFAVPAKKDAAAKQQRAASVAPDKNALAAKKANVAPGKKAPVAAAKQASVTPPKKVAKHQRAAVSKRQRMASADPNQVPQPRVRQESTESAPAPTRIPKLFASADPVSEARRWIGTNPTDRSTLWCARFMNFVLERSGYSGTGSDAAKSFASYGRRISGPQVGAIAVMSRGKNGGHVGIVSGIDASGNPIIISGNSNGRRVYEGAYPRGRIYAYVLPR